MNLTQEQLSEPGIVDKMADSMYAKIKTLDKKERDKFFKSLKRAITRGRGR